MSFPAQAADPWRECEKAVHWIPTELYRIAGEVDSAEPANLDQVNFAIVLPEGMRCPSDQKFEDMPKSLRARMHEFVGDLDEKPPSYEGRTAAEALEAYRQFAQIQIRAKVSSTFSTKVTGALEYLREQNESLRKELARRRQRK